VSRRLLSKPSHQHCADSICQHAVFPCVLTEHTTELFEGEPKQAIYTRIVHLRARVCEVKTFPTTEIVATWEQKDDPDSLSTWLPIRDARAAKPEAFASKMTIRCRYPYSFINKRGWTRKGTGDFLAEVKNHFSLAALKQSKGHDLNLLPGRIGPLA
jgi:hypothetical protein